MSNLVLHDATASAVDRFVKRPAHALLVVGPAGIGKKAFVRQLVGLLLGVDDAGIDAYPYQHVIAPSADKASIGIEAVRDLQQFAKLKLPAGPQNKRLLVIYDSHTLTTEAQNALLKLIEEPPLDTTIILTATDEQALLPTIRSRAQQLTIHRPPRAQLDAYFASHGHDSISIAQAYLLSGGLPGLQQALLSSEDHPLKQSVQMARTILQGTAFQRLCLVDELAKKRSECMQVLFALQHMARAAIEQTVQRSTEPAAAYKRLKQWHKVHKAAYEAEQSLRANAQAKLVLDNLMLTL